MTAAPPLGYTASTPTVDLHRPARVAVATAAVLALLALRAAATHAMAPTWSPARMVLPLQNGYAQGLETVSCVSDSFCWAGADVGADGFGQATRWNGSGWKVQPLTGAGAIVAVSCPSQAFCMAVDDNGDAIAFRDGAWGRPVQIDGASVVVKPDAAKRQLEEEAAPSEVQAAEAEAMSIEPRPEAGVQTLPAKKAVRRFFAVKSLDPQRVSRDADQIATEIVTHLVGLVGADVEVKLEITAEVADGVPDDVVRTVTENAKTLKFDQHGFELE